MTDRIIPREHPAALLRRERELWGVYLLEGPDAEGKMFGREFGCDYHSRAEAEAVRTQYAADWPRHTYFVRKIDPDGDRLVFIDL